MGHAAPVDGIWSGPVSAQERGSGTGVGAAGLSRLPGGAGVRQPVFSVAAKVVFELAGDVGPQPITQLIKGLAEAVAVGEGHGWGAISGRGKSGLLVDGEKGITADFRLPRDHPQRGALAHTVVGQGERVRVPSVLPRAMAR